ncbi:bifunctional diaminohydroxyphosphoribosylaminopyrimidine deaminase/5-amino-6-(5-phosphoribosylamino)uracil reductase RibD [Massilia sp. B-10]|nr:bifunctional diaminohydroxyphosphoribosylaminopyrimidine deaminase/5-amino-6-(5-phosphoribosylamino)uracil reductase RibD [Massilia sp. B-10]
MRDRARWRRDRRLAILSPAGQAHAEIQALRDAEARGNDVRGATAYVTLEPCNHHGRTPPCSDALVRGPGPGGGRHGRPQSAGGGAGTGQAGSGLSIAVSSGLMAHEAYELNIGFFSRMQRGRPWGRLKAAASLDGMTALHSGESQWITGPEARADGHAWRARACAILTGIGTVKADDPQLNVRAVDTPRQPRRIIVDSKLEIDPGARVLQGAASWIVAATANPEKEALLRGAGHDVILLPNAA